MGYCEKIPFNCQGCNHPACEHLSESPHPCICEQCEAFMFPEGTNESQFVGGGGSSGGGGATGSW